MFTHRLNQYVLKNITVSTGVIATSPLGRVITGGSLIREEETLL